MPAKKMPAHKPKKVKSPINKGVTPGGEKTPGGKRPARAARKKR